MASVPIVEALQNGAASVPIVEAVQNGALHFNETALSIAFHGFTSLISLEAPVTISFEQVFSIGGDHAAGDPNFFRNQGLEHPISNSHKIPSELMPRWVNPPH